MLKKHLADEFGSFWLSGEIFELYTSPAGHNYFTLKDQNASIKCVFFKQKQTVRLKKDMQVTALGHITLYAVKGDLQVNVLRLIESGQGDLAQQFEILKHKLQQAGMFENKRKKPIPSIISSLGIITSARGAALQDILNVIKQHNPLISIHIYPTPVQGPEAPPQINHSLREADDNNHDVLLLTRGGGSKEDLWAFNDEFLAHQIAQLNTPIISAVGHETDESISDLVADMNCITPTAAAHIIAGGFEQLSQRLSHNQRILALLIQDKLRIAQQKIDSLHHRIEKRHPENKLQQQRESLRAQIVHLNQSLKNLTQYRVNQFTQIKQHLNAHKPNTLRTKAELEHLNQQLTWQLTQQLAQAKQQLTLTVNDLNHLNPLTIMTKGYSMTTKLADGTLIHDSKQLKVGDDVATQFKSGRIHAKIFERLDD